MDLPKERGQTEFCFVAITSSAALNHLSTSIYAIAVKNILILTLDTSMERENMWLEV